MKWRYSLRWKLPSPCPGPHELASEVVEAGQPAPESIMSRWVAGAGYAVCVDFPDERQIKRWSDERKAAARRRNLERCGMKIKFHHFMLNEPIDLIGWSACYL